MEVNGDLEVNDQIQAKNGRSKSYCIKYKQAPCIKYKLKQRIVGDVDGR